MGTAVFWLTSRLMHRSLSDIAQDHLLGERCCLAWAVLSYINKQPRQLLIVTHKPRYQTDKDNPSVTF